MTKWIDFYRPFFASDEETKTFVKICEELAPDVTNHNAKIMMHQTQRLVLIANDLSNIRPGREALQLLFLMICVEHISKLHDGFTGEGQSKKYVKRFFAEFITESAKDKLEKSFIDNSSTPMKALGLDKAVDLLYSVRCDVVHEGNYWGFSFHDGLTPMVNGDPDVNVYITLRELRDIIVQGCIRAIKDKLKP
jgi:hypothetical protein